tara:strand:- start:752 stop:1999 length:1248 start_codon:yes stop_codon:yes gene_type:complete
MESRITKKPKINRQYELSQQKIIDNAVNFGGSPDIPATSLAPDNRPNINRGTITSKNDSKANPDFYLGLQAIDEAIFYYFENVIKPTVLSNGDLVDVPVIYGSGERWKLAQKDGFYRDKNQKIQTPLVMLKRESIEKRRDLGNKLDANAPQLYITQQEKYTRKNSYDRFALLNNRIPKKEFNAVVVPDYVNLTYNGIIWTDYISQLNKIIEAVNYSSDSYWGDPERFKFMAMIDSFNNINELSSDDGRIVRANFTLKLQGYVVPDNVQKKLKEQNTRYFSKAQIVLNQATTVIEEPSTRKKVFTPTTKAAGGGGGAIQNTTTTNTVTDDDWQIFDQNILSTKDVDIQGYLHLDFDSDSINPNNDEDLFLIKRGGITQLRVDKEGLLSLKEFPSLPSSVTEGGIAYFDNNFYLGLG